MTARFGPPVGLIALALAIYHRMLTPGWALADFDLAVHVEPYRQAMVAAWRAGRLPLWNPDVFLGAPFLANIQTASLYPFNLLYLLLPTPAAMSWMVALHLGIGAAGMYSLARSEVRAGVAGGVVAGVVYMLSDYTTAHAGFETMVLAWTPWLMLATARLAARPAPRGVGVVALLVALIVLAGHSQQAYYTFILAAITALPKLWRRFRQGRRATVVLGIAAGLLGVAIGAGIAALQLVATIELTRLSARSGGLPLDLAAQFSLPIHGVMQDFLPDYLYEHRAEYAFSVGAAALTLAAVAVAFRARRADVQLWATVGLAGFAVALGAHSPLFRLLHAVAPGFNLFRVPARTLVFTTVAAALLAGVGTRTAIQLARQGRPGRHAARLALAGAVAAAAPAAAVADLLAHNPDRGAWKLFPRDIDPSNVRLLVVFTALALTALLAPMLLRRAGAAAVAVPALVVVELVMLGTGTYPRNPLPDTIYTLPAAAEEMVPASADSRYISLLNSFEGDLPVDESPGAALSAADRARFDFNRRLRDPMLPNTNLGSGRLSLDGYDAGVLPLRAEVAFRAALLPAGADNSYDVSIHDLTPVVASVDRLRDSGVALVLTAQGANPNATGSDLHPVATAHHLVAWAPSGPTPTRAWVLAADGSRRAAHVVADHGEDLTVELPPGGAGTLVLADAYYPGWEASVDGRPAQISSYLGYLRQVRVPAGAQTVEFRYRPWWLVPGIAASLVSLLVAVLLIAWPARRLMT